MIKKIAISLLLFAVCTNVWSADYSARIQMLDVQIAQLLAKNNEDILALKKCEKSTKGFKIAGISTLSLTGVGIGVNIGQAVKQGKLKKEDGILSQTLAQKASQKLSAQTELELLRITNSKKIDEYNNILSLHKDLIIKISTSCVDTMKDYVAFINSLSFAETKDDIKIIPYDYYEIKQLFEKLLAECTQKINNETVTDNESVSDIEDTKDTDDANDQEDDLCPAVNPRWQSAAGKAVGDGCSGGKIVSGVISKYKPGTVRDGKDVGGTCTCVAHSCIDGFEVSSGACVEKKDKKDKKESNVDTVFFEVCGKDKGKTGKIERCVEFFNGKSGGVKANVQMISGIGLAQEYAKIKFNDEIVCANSFREFGYDDVLACKSVNSAAFYEFVFDDLVESYDADIRKSIAKSLCVMYGGNPSGANAYSCMVNSATCGGALKTIANKFSFELNYTGQACVFSQSNYSYDKMLNLARLDNLGITGCEFFMGDIQIKAGQNVPNAIREYIRSKGGDVSNFSCNNRPTQVSAADARRTCGLPSTMTSMGWEKDDVLRCFVNNQPVDFVFDDLSELEKVRDRGGKQAMDCVITGGTFNGQACMGLNQQQCNSIKAISANDCPDCKSAVWNPISESCELPDSRFVSKYDKGIKIGAQVAGIAAGAIITVASFGTAAPVLVIVGGAMATAGGIVTTTANIVISSRAQEFFKISESCKDSSCAERILAQSMQKVTALQGEFSDAEFLAVDKELVRLLDLLPEGSEFIDKTLFYLECNNSGWTSEQIWRAAGTVLSLAGVATSIYGMLNSAGKLGLTANEIDRIIRSARHTTGASRSAVEAVRITNAEIRQLESIIDGGARFITRAGGNMYQIQYGTGAAFQQVRNNAMIALINALRNGGSAAQNATNIGILIGEGTVITTEMMGSYAIPKCP